MKLVFASLCALLCATSVFTFPTSSKQVPPQCADPTFACQDLESARECGVVKSCIHDIWATMSAPDDNDEICDICKEMVKEARDQLLSNMTQEEIKEVFEGSCKLLPVKLVADACIKVVDEIIPELVEMLASRMDPTMVCTVSGLCNMAHLPIENHVLKFLRLVLIRDPVEECTECTTLMTDLKIFLKSTPKSEVKTIAETVCDEKAPKYLCDLLVGSYFPKVYDYVVSSDPKQMCTEAGVCKQTCKSNEQPQKVKDELTCEFCDHVLEHIKQEIIANSTVEEFRTALLNFCKLMGSFSSECTSLVDDYYDTIFDYIRKLDTKAFCTLIGLCDKTKCVLAVTPLVKLVPPFETRNRIPLVKIQPAIHVSGNSGLHPLVKVVPAIIQSKHKIEESNDIFSDPKSNSLPVERFSHPVINFERDTQCAFCQAITFYLQQDLKGDKSKVGIRNAMSNVCSKWVKEFPEHCEDFLNKYSQKVMLAIAEDIEYESICRQVKACPLEDTNSELEVKVVRPKVNDRPFCDLCKEAMNEVENQLKDPATKAQFEKLLHQACNILPKSLQDECTSFIDQNVDALFSILEQELTPDNICPTLGFCNATLRIPPPQILKDMECDLCKEAVTSLRQQLENPQFKQTILNFLEEGCSRLPGDLAKECKTFVDENIDTAIGVIVQAMDPDTVCSILKICPGSVKKVTPPRSNDIECDLCKEAMSKLEDILKEKSTEDEIRDALDKVCSLLPSSMSIKCKTFINQYTDTIITLLIQGMDPGMICAALKLCPAKEHFDEWQAKAQDVECQSCQYALHFLQEQLESPETQDEVKNVLKKMCDVLPQSYSTNCEAFVDQYGSAFLALLAQEIDPNTLCWELKMCSNQTRLFKVFSPKEKHTLTKADECMVCTTVVDYLDKLLEEDDIDKDITALVEKVCVVLPKSLTAQCQTTIEGYGPYILQMIGQLANSQEVCQDIDLCPRTPGHVHLLGGHKCTFGPSYWCQSNAHAAACKAEMYCKQKMWNQ